MSRSYWRSFNGGEMTPEFFGQIGDAKFQTGLARCRNFRVLPHGPVHNRAGFEFVREVKDSSKATRLLPFEYSTTQTMVLELGDTYVRFHTQGATLLSAGIPYELATPYAAADLFGLKYVQSADVLSLVNTLYPPAELRRLGALSWTHTPISFVATLAAPTLPQVAASGATGTLSVHSYAVTSVAANNIDESLVSVPALDLASGLAIVSITNANPAVLQIVAHGRSIGDIVSISAALGMPEINGYSYRVATTPTVDTLTLTRDGVVVDSSAFGTYTGSGVFYLNGVKNNLFTTGAFNTISWTAVAGALRYNVYKYSNGLWGYVGQASGTSFVDDNITPDISKTPPEVSNPFAGAGDYPGAVTYFEQRRCFAGTLNKPQTLWLTRSGTESNMAYSIPSRDNDSITFRVTARQANTVRHLVPLNNLLALTSSAEWRVSSINSDALTPTTTSVGTQSFVGAGDAQPVIVNNNVVFAAARGGHVREMAFNFQVGGYMTGDLSLRAPHLFDGYSIVDMAFSKSPYPTVWAVSSSGLLLGLTYVPEQGIGAWHWHDTDGVFESICVVAEGPEDVLYAIVRRTINGAQKRYVERMRPRPFVSLADAFFVDCGATFTSATPVQTVSGAGWLEGKTVNILADGAVHRPLVVTGGSFTLDYPASKIQFGLPIVAEFQTLPLALEMQGFGQGMRKNINKVYTRVSETSGIWAGPSFSDLVEAKTRTDEPYGSPPRLQSRILEVVSRGAWTDDAQACIRQSNPLPVTITGLALDLATGG